MRRASLVQTAIWENAEFLSLSSFAKLVYLMLITQPTVATTGVLPLTLRRWQKNIDAGALEAGLTELEQTGFIWIDEANEELLIRSWIKHNVAGRGKMEKAAKDQVIGIHSHRIKAQLGREYPDLFNGTISPTDTVSDTPSIHHPGYPIDTQSDSTWSVVRGQRPVEPPLDLSRNRSSKPAHGDDKDQEQQPRPTLPAALAQILDAKITNDLKPAQVELVTRAWNEGTELRHSLADVEAAENPTAMLVSVAKRIAPADDKTPAEREAAAAAKRMGAVQRCRYLWHQGIDDHEDLAALRDHLEREYRHDPSIVIEAIGAP